MHGNDLGILVAISLLLSKTGANAGCSFSVCVCFQVYAETCECFAGWGSVACAEHRKPWTHP